MRIDSSGLKTGDYYGQIQISAAGVANSPQTASVVLNVARAANGFGSSYRSHRLDLCRPGGWRRPRSEDHLGDHSSTSTLTFSAGTTFHQSHWLTVQPATHGDSAIQATFRATDSHGLAAGISGEIRAAVRRRQFYASHRSAARRYARGCLRNYRTRCFPGLHSAHQAPTGLHPTRRKLLRPWPPGRLPSKSPSSMIAATS